MRLKIDFVYGPWVFTRICHQSLEPFFCAFWRSGFACATIGRALRE
jgi:hypothetical protein